MARVTYGAMITELAGSIGGVTFQKNNSGNIARLKPKLPVNPSPGQAAQEYLLAYLNSLWPTLSQIEKDSWATFAAAYNHNTPWGEEKTLNGYQWFMSCNLNLLRASEAAIETAPVFSTVDPPDEFTLTADGDDLLAVFDSAYTAVPDYLYIYLSTPIKRASLKLRNPLYLVDVDSTFNDTDLSLTYLFETLCNVTWADFFAASHCNIICRLLKVEAGTGLASAFTSGIIKIG